MNSLTRWENRRWNPFREMEDLQSRLASMFNLAPIRPANGDEAMTLSQWAPLVDIAEDEKEYQIKAEVPEVKKEDLQVTVENGVLSISGERKFEKEETGKKYHRQERSYGSFVRTFSLPEAVDPAGVQAEFKDGVLLVHLPKSEKARPKSIEVKIS